MIEPACPTELAATSLHVESAVRRARIQRVALAVAPSGLGPMVRSKGVGDGGEGSLGSVAPSSATIRSRHRSHTLRMVVPACGTEFALARLHVESAISLLWVQRITSRVDLCISCCFGRLQNCLLALRVSGHRSGQALWMIPLASGAKLAGARLGEESAIWLVRIQRVARRVQGLLRDTLRMLEPAIRAKLARPRLHVEVAIRDARVARGVAVRVRAHQFHGELVRLGGSIRGSSRCLRAHLWMIVPASGAKLALARLHVEHAVLGARVQRIALTVHHTLVSTSRGCNGAVVPGDRGGHALTVVELASGAELAIPGLHEKRAVLRPTLRSALTGKTTVRNLRISSRNRGHALRVVEPASETELALPCLHEEGAVLLPWVQRVTGGVELTSAAAARLRVVETASGAKPALTRLHVETALRRSWVQREATAVQTTLRCGVRLRPHCSPVAATRGGAVAAEL
mmetsp:Transcript_122949/g.309404  ORF Transcript_122949/g.309404 Transcript_122949/m.309404 type:complete len:459 (-) Transcript_122949:114-1490(-)